MNKHTLIHAGTAVDNPHQYNVIIGTDIGQFSGTVECKAEDWGRESKFFGFELAEIKANIKYARAKKKHFEAQLCALKEFWGNMSKTRTYDDTAFWVKKIEQQIEELEGTVKWWKGRIQFLQESYHLKIITFDSFNSSRKRCEEYNYD